MKDLSKFLFVITLIITCLEIENVLLDIISIYDQLEYTLMSYCHI